MCLTLIFKNVIFKLNLNFYDFLIFIYRPSISMNCTKKITTKCTIELNSTTNFVNNLMNYIQFLLLCCPNLESIDFVLTYDSKLKTDFSDSGSYESTSDDSVSLLSPEEFVTNLESFFTSIIDYLKNLENGGKDLKIKIEFYSEFAAHTFDVSFKYFLIYISCF